MCLLSAALAIGAMSIPAAFAQQEGDGNAPAAPNAQQQDNGGRRGNRQGRGDPAQWRQRMADRLKQDLGASDEEFAALQPKIEHLMQLRRDANGGGGPRMGRGRGGPGGRGAEGPGREANANPTPVQQSLSDLRKTLENKDASADDIKAKLEAVRQAKAKARDELTKAQQELREVVTQRQEAALVLMGLLD
jgi:hypothetical protein